MTIPDKEHVLEVRANALGIGDIVADSDRRERAPLVIAVYVFHKNKRRLERSNGGITRAELSQFIGRIAEFRRRNNQVFRLVVDCRQIFQCTLNSSRNSLDRNHGVWTIHAITIQQVPDIFPGGNTILCDTFLYFQQTERLVIFELHQAQIGIATNRNLDYAAYRSGQDPFSRIGSGFPLVCHGIAVKTIKLDIVGQHRQRICISISLEPHII